MSNLAGYVVVAAFAAVCIVAGVTGWRLRHLPGWNIPACNDDFIFF